VVGTFHEQQFFGRMHELEHLFQFDLRAVLVVGAANKQFGLGAVLQEVKFITAIVYGRNRQTQTYHGFYPFIGTSDGESNGGPEGKTGEDQRQMKFLVQPIEGGTDIVGLALSVIVLAFAQSGAAEIEAKDGDSETVERLHGVERDLVVHGAAEQGMRMADQGGVWRIRDTAVEQSFQAAGRAIEKKGADGGRRIRHLDQSNRTDCGMLLRMDLVAFTRRLVDIDSTTGSEGAVGECLLRELQQMGLQAERMAVEPARSNVFATWPEHPRPEIVFSTHMDTVPPFIPSSEDEKRIYGRGACDAKGIIAAQIAAARKLHGEGIHTGLLFLVGEERDSLGAKVASQQGRGSRFLVNGEPTENRIATVSKGALRVELTAQGRMAHSAYPELGESAIDKLLQALARLQAMKLPSDSQAGPCTLNVGLIEGGRAPNVIPDFARAQLLYRLVGPATELKEQIVSAVGGLATADFILEIPFVRLETIAGLPTMAAAFTTDIPALSNWGKPLLLCPGSIHVAHTEGEYVEKKQLYDALDLYCEIAKKLMVQA